MLSSCKSNASEFVLRNSSIPLMERTWLAQQITYRAKARKKHPSFFRFGSFYLEKAIEQSTSEVVANEKVNLIMFQDSLNVCDLTGGMGAETIAFAGKGAKVDYVEPDIYLFQLSNYNFSRFPFAKQICLFQTDAVRFLANNKQYYDLALLDPDRRAEGKRDFTLEKSSPNPLLLESEILKTTKTLWIKHSPMIDIEYLLGKFDYLKTLFIISHKNEVKEVSTLHSTSTVSFKPIECICIDSVGNSRKIGFDIGERDHLANVQKAHRVKKYFFEPDKAIIKSGCSNAYAISQGLESLSANMPYYTSECFPNDFAGRVFEVVDSFLFNEKSLRSYLKQHKIRKASIGARGFVIKANEIEKKFRLLPDDTEHFFFFINHNGGKEVIRCKSYLPKASI